MEDLIVKTREALANLLSVIASVLLLAVALPIGFVCVLVLQAARYLLIPLIVLAAVLNPIPMPLLARIRYEVRFWLAMTKPERISKDLETLGRR